jgi:hypothetical protein
MGNRVKRVRTEVSEPQMAQAMSNAWRELFGTTPSKEQIGLLLAQNALETGHRKSMWNFNVGNITTDGKGQYNFFDDLPTDEQIKPGQWKKMNLKYRAYPSLVEGAKDYLKLISGKRYSKAWENILNPDPVAFSKSLKESGYYTANEAPYTKALTKLYKQFSGSNIQDKVAPTGKEDVFDKYLANMKGTGLDVFKDLGNQNTPSALPLNNILNNYLQMIAASEKHNKKLYRALLPTQQMVIKIAAPTYTDAIEFARILCTALDEELLAKSYTHSNNQQVEVQCAIPGPSEECLDAVTQLTNSIADAFTEATSKIGGVHIKTQCVMNKKSSYQQINIKTADHQHRKFLLKFI